MRAHSPGTLPADGAAVVGGVTLPIGHRKVADATQEPRGAVDPHPAIWITDRDVSDVRDVWLKLAGEFPRTGLWPLIAQNFEVPAGTVGPTGRPWDDGEFEPANVSGIAHNDPARVLAENWQLNKPEEHDAVTRDIFTPLSPDAFPGLAPMTTSCARDALQAVAGSLHGRIAVIGVMRPADAIARLGWEGPANYTTATTTMAKYDEGMSAVLRSWEDRFGAYLIALGLDTATLVVTRPPTTSDAALRVTAEHFAFAPDNILQGSGSFNAYERTLKDARKWVFWWD